MRQILSGLLNKYVRSTAGLFWQKRREIKKKPQRTANGRLRRWWVVVLYAQGIMSLQVVVDGWMGWMR